MVKFMVAGYPKSGNNWLIHLLKYNIVGPTYNVNEKNTTIYRTEQIEPPKYPKILYVVRHPLDVMLSYRNYEAITGRQKIKDFNIYVDEWYNRKGTTFRKANWIQHVRYWEKQAPLIVRYEDLLNNGIETLTNIYKYCNLEEGVAKEALEAIEFNKLKKYEDKKAEQEDWEYFFSNRPTDKEAIRQGKRFFNKGRCYYFKEELTEEQIDKGLQVFKDLLIKYWPDEECTKKLL